MVHLRIYSVLPIAVSLCLRLYNIHQTVLRPNPYLFYRYPSSKPRVAPFSYYRYRQQRLRLLWSNDGRAAISTKSEIQRVEPIRLVLKIFGGWWKACISYWYRLEIAIRVLQTQNQLHWQSQQVWPSQSADPLARCPRKKTQNLTRWSFQITSVLTPWRWHCNQLRFALRRRGKKAKEARRRRAVEKETRRGGKIETAEGGRWDWKIEEKEIIRGRLRWAPWNRISWPGRNLKSWEQRRISEEKSY